MAISDRIRRLRQQRLWSRAELDEQLGVHQKQVSAYERGLSLPSTEVLIKLADVFNVTLDDLAFEAKGHPTSPNIQDRELRSCFEEVDTPSDQEKSLAKEILDLVIIGHRFRELAGPKTAIG